MWLVQGLIRVLAFVRKELFGVLRQPRLIISLVLGPFIIMALFGLGYQGSLKYNTILVIPNREGISTNPADYQEFSKQAFKLNTISKNENDALARLDRKEADVVIVVPDSALDDIYNGQSARFPTYYRDLNPVQANFIEYSSYVYASELDKVILRETLTANKPSSAQFQQLTTQTNTATGSLDKAMQQGNLVEAKVQVQTLLVLNLATRRSLDTIILPGNGPDQPTQQKLLSSKVTGGIFQSALGQMRNDLTNSDAKLKALDDGFNRGDVNSPQQRANLDGVRQSNASLAQKVDRVANIPPAVMVEPIRAEAKNQTSTRPTYINFYGPAVVILLLQHLAVTLVALSNVRDRLIGVLEILRVAPIGPAQVFTGKFFSFGLLLITLGALLVGLITLALGVPFVNFEARWLIGLAVLAVTIYASIGLGFLISGISRTESQAVQWSMLLLLASIFFTGFIVPISQFTPLIQYVGYALPMTFGAVGLQNVMLDTLTLDPTLLLIPLVLGTFYLIIGLLLYRRQFNIA